MKIKKKIPARGSPCQHCNSKIPSCCIPGTVCNLQPLKLPFGLWCQTAAEVRDSTKTRWAWAQLCLFRKLNIWHNWESFSQETGRGSAVHEVWDQLQCQGTRGTASSPCQQHRTFLSTPLLPPPSCSRLGVLGKKKDAGQEIRA